MWPFLHSATYIRWVFKGTFATLMVLVLAFTASLLAAPTGSLKLDVLGGAGAKPNGEVYGLDGRKVAEVAPGATIELPPGSYRFVLPLVGGKITKDEVRIEAGRTHTLLIETAAVLRVNVKNRDGKEPGYGVTVTDTNSHAKIAEFISGDAGLLLAPQQVDVKVDAPPQGYVWHAVALPPGRAAELTLSEVVPAELVVQPMLSNLAIDKETRVVIYQAGTQKQVAVSDPAPEHRFKIEPGDYDVYVENRAGVGRPYATSGPIHLNGGDKVERRVAMDTANAPASAPENSGAAPAKSSIGATANH
jgi:hypothetical protein